MFDNSNKEMERVFIATCFVFCCTVSSRLQNCCHQFFRRWGKLPAGKSNMCLCHILEMLGKYSGAGEEALTVEFSPDTPSFSLARVSTQICTAVLYFEVF